MKFLSFIFLILLMLLLTACPEDNPVITDPCAGKKPVSASFKIYEDPVWLPNGTNWIYYDTDTIALTSAIFIADDSTADEYEWHLGSEIINTRSFSRTDFPRKQHFPVTLIIRKKPDTLCFPSDDGIDTLKRIFYTLGLDSTGFIEKDIWSGNYYGYNKDEISKPFTISINDKYLDTNDKFSPIKTRIQNLTPNSDIYRWDEIVYTYKEIYFKDNLNYDYLTPRGIMKLSGVNNDTLTIDYNIQTAPGYQNIKNRIDKIFKGVRIK
jgi:hypothetical protein